MEVIKLLKREILSLEGLHNVENGVIIFLFYLILYTQHYGKERSPGVWQRTISRRLAKNDLPASGQRTISRCLGKERSPGVWQRTISRRLGKELRILHFNKKECVGFTYQTKNFRLQIIIGSATLDNGNDDLVVK